MPIIGAPIGVELTEGAGSIAENFSSSFGIVNLNAPTLQGLINTSSTDNLSYSNPAGVTNSQVVIELAPINMISSGVIRLVKGDNTDYYEMTVPSGNTGKRVVLTQIPNTFLADFNIYNGTGVTLKSSGNFITIIPT